MQFKLTHLIMLLFFCQPAFSYSMKCMDYIDHAGIDEGINFLPKSDIRNSAYTYVTDPSSDYMIAYAKSFKNVKVRFLDGGKKIEVLRSGLGVGLELKDGQCVNSYNWWIENPRDYKKEFDAPRSIDHDWRLCNQLKKIKSESPTDAHFLLNLKKISKPWLKQKFFMVNIEESAKALTGKKLQQVYKSCLSMDRSFKDGSNSTREKPIGGSDQSGVVR